MKSHCKSVSQHMINNSNNMNNSKNNNNNNNNNPPVVLKYQVGIRQGIAIPHGQVRIFSLC